MSYTSLDSLKYFASVLRLISIPAGALELLPESKRDAIEAWLWETSRKGLKALGVSAVIFYVAILILTHFAPYVVMILVFLPLGSLFFLVLVAHLLETVWGRLIVGLFIACVAVGLFCPPRWIIKVGAPLEMFLHQLPRSGVLAYLIPDYSGEVFLAQFNSSVESVRGWLWHWLAWLNSLYFGLAKALIVFVIVLLEVSFAAVTLIVCVLPIFLTAYLFLRLSNALKVAMGITTKGRLPVGAFVVVAVGEVLTFVVETVTFFHGEGPGH